MRMETRNKRNGVADAAQAARGFGENGGGTSITTTSRPDKAAIKEALKAGQQITGAQLTSRRSWRIR